MESNNEKKKKLDYFLNECYQLEENPDIAIAKTRYKIEQYKIRQKRRMIAASISVAASIFIAVGLFIFSENNDIQPDFGKIAETIAPVDVDGVVLTTKDGILTLDNEAYIKYNDAGVITINGESVSTNNSTKHDSNSEYDALTVSAGKKARVELHDGTIIDVNSRSKIIYPRNFKGRTRNIYAEGEAFLDVAHDKKHPFIVSTERFNLTVLGTQFNITAYPEAKSDQVVLVEGAVEVADRSDKTIQMTPNDLLTVADGNIVGIEKTDVLRYISWREGRILLDGYKLSEIVTKLNLHYGTNIICSNDVANEKMFGYVYLQESAEEMVEVFQDIIPIRIVKSKTDIRIEKR